MSGIRETPTDPKALPEYWWAREKESDQIIPVQIWRTTSPGFNDSVAMFGSTGGYDIKFYELLELIAPPTTVQKP